MNKKIQQKGKNTSKKITFKPTGVNLTSQAGLIPASKFLESNNLSRIIKNKTLVERANNATYQFCDMVEYCILGVIGGARHLSGISDIWKDSALCEMLSWHTTPDDTAVSRLFKSLSLKDIVDMENVVHSLRKEIWKKHFLRNRDSSIPIIIDVDSTVKTSYGNQEGSEKGFNSSKKGAKSFHQQIAFCAETKEILQSWYRCGSAYTSNGIVDFMQQLTANLPKNEKFYFRADSGYFSESLLVFLEDNNYDFLIKVKIKNLTTLLEKQEWSKIEKKNGWEEATFSYKCSTWDKERTFKAVRLEILEENPDEILLEVKRYEYFCYVVSELNLSSWDTHKKYGQRATCETWIEEGKNQVALGSIKSNSFIASSIFYQITVLAYNTFRYIGLVSGNKKIIQWEPKTIRTYLIRTAGKLITGSRQLKLITPSNHFFQSEWDDWIKTGNIVQLAS